MQWLWLVVVQTSYGCLLLGAAAVATAESDTESTACATAKVLSIRSLVQNGGPEQYFGALL